ncbi:protein-tyrosine phosphatase [Trypanosoma rangeli]|uniref:Protein-tyrosine phosphatase n=1 Tax=Trypanosoma rangeli TaxID=5698 RepID=A0A3R7NCX6_TRYRA|nr:protein-tyrosine phosphatase [Trypanosoma rangeli]RNF04542.1 protein-tyrosine phosphatase [Trypanosoma rangeli]|eukprot:RNF04542.1 protein-tyrosine phosphatase [Trypanosoma rangeli]
MVPASRRVVGKRMIAPPADCDAHKERLLAEFLAARIGDSIVDVSQAINAKFFSHPLENVRGTAPKNGRIFLTSAAGARRGNITAKLIFGGDRRAASTSLTGGCHLKREEKPDAEKNRWIRGVLIVSSTIPPPSASVFLDRHGNGCVFFFGGHNVSVQLLVRVVGVPLPPFIPHASTADSTTTTTMQLSAREKYRQILLETELSFLKSLEACLVWLLRSQWCEKMQRKSHDSHLCRDLKGPASLVSASFFTEEPATLSVPLYYLPMHVEDNANSRLADVVGFAAEFMDLILDAEKSVVKETTTLLQQLVRLFSMMENSTEGDSDAERTNKKSEEDVKEFLYHLYSRAASLLQARCHRHSHASMIVNSSNKRLPGADGTPTLPIGCNDGECSVPLSELVLDDSTVDLEPSPCVPDDSYNSDVGDPSSSTGASCDVQESQGQATLEEKEGDSICTTCSLPGVLVHCMKGVSRSPSVIMAYYLHKCCREFYALSRIPRHAELAYPITSAAVDDMEDVYVFSFHRLLECLQEARPVVNPQICFLAELRSMWVRLSKKMAEKEAEKNL